MYSGRHRSRHHAAHSHIRRLIGADHYKAVLIGLAPIMLLMCLAAHPRASVYIFVQEDTPFHEVLQYVEPPDYSRVQIIDTDLRSWSAEAIALALLSEQTDIREVDHVHITLSLLRQVINTSLASPGCSWGMGALVSRNLKW